MKNIFFAKYKIFYLFLFYVLLISFFCKPYAAQERKENYSLTLEDPQPPNLRSLPFFSTKLWSNSGSDREKKNVSAIILHETREYNTRRYLKKSLKNNWLVHFVVDKKGNVFGGLSPFEKILRANPAMDAQAIHVSVEGEGGDVIKNEKQVQSLLQLLQYLQTQGNIPANNYDVGSKRGIFTYKQVMKKYGHFVRLGDAQVEKLLQVILPLLKDGRYYSEVEWKDRFSDDWVLRRENTASLKARQKLDRGRDFSSLPMAELECAQKTAEGNLIQSMRLNYPFRGKIHPTCVVLHYTATTDFLFTLKVLEDRRLGSQIIVDTDGKIYQVMDFLNDKAAAAYGTNGHCLQVEIVGKDTKQLLKNREQLLQVVTLVKEFSQMYNIKLDNYNIESLNGIFSHTQAKKLWGKSAYLDSGDYDPGEPYMKKVLRKAGGIYYPEKKWHERMSNHWIILYGDFQP